MNTVKGMLISRVGATRGHMGVMGPDVRIDARNRCGDARRRVDESARPRRSGGGELSIPLEVGWA